MGGQSTSQTAVGQALCVEKVNTLFKVIHSYIYYIMYKYLYYRWILRYILNVYLWFIIYKDMRLWLHILLYIIILYINI